MLYEVITASANEHTFQADYANPIAKGQTLEMGAKYIIRLNDSKTNESYKYFDFSEAYPYTPYITADSISSFSNDQDILGSYLSYTGNFGKWGLKGVITSYSIHYTKLYDFYRCECQAVLQSPRAVGIGNAR